MKLFLMLFCVMFCCLEKVSSTVINCSRWANEDCKINSDCCTGTCHRSHPGTNHRCTRSGMNGPCIFRYHCHNGLTCGPGYKCCAGHWTTCTRDEDCCDRKHVCIHENGFTYRMCLVPSKLKLAMRKYADNSAQQYRYVMDPLFASIMFSLTKVIL